MYLNNVARVAKGGRNEKKPLPILRTEATERAPMDDKNDNAQCFSSLCLPLCSFEWRKLHNEELYAPYSSSNIIRVIKSRRLRWAGHVARMGERRGAYRVLVGKPKALDGRIILK